MSFRKRKEDGTYRKGKRVLIDCQAAVKAGERWEVEQSKKEEVDINNIVKRAGSAELIAKVNSLVNWTYDDVTGNDFKESMNALIKARDTFDNVPSDIRKQFGNDPAEFMDFVQNPDNSQQLIDWGLKNPPEPPTAPIEVAVVSSPETPPEAT